MAQRPHQSALRTFFFSVLLTLVCLKAESECRTDFFSCSHNSFFLRHCRGIGGTNENTSNGLRGEVWLTMGSSVSGSQAEYSDANSFCSHVELLEKSRSSLYRTLRLYVFVSV